MIFVILVVKTLLKKSYLTICGSGGRNQKVAGPRPVSAINPRGALRTSVQFPANDRGIHD